jgi:hypothetical protein
MNGDKSILSNAANIVDLKADDLEDWLQLQEHDGLSVQAICAVRQQVVVLRDAALLLRDLVEKVA